MKLQGVITGVLLGVVITVLVLMALRVRVAASADSVAVLRTTGMTCTSCSEKISQALETVRGVAVTEVDVEGGWVIVGYDPKKVQPESLAQKVKGTGFPSQLQVVLTPAQFKQVTGRDVGQMGGAGKGCCGKGGCGGGKT